MTSKCTEWEPPRPGHTGGVLYRYRRDSLTYERARVRRISNGYVGEAWSCHTVIYPAYEVAGATLEGVKSCVDQWLVDNGYLAPEDACVDGAGDSFEIQPWSYWERGGHLLVMTDDAGVHTCDPDDGKWSYCGLGLYPGDKLVRNPVHRHPNDPVARVAKAKALIEEIGLDAVKAAIKEVQDEG